MYTKTLKKDFKVMRYVSDYVLQNCQTFAINNKM